VINTAGIATNQNNGSVNTDVPRDVNQLITIGLIADH
jgi:hypothetical protein